MRIHVLVEGAADKAFLDAWLPRFLPKHQFVVHPHQGKGRLPAAPVTRDRTARGLLDQLPAKLIAYGRTLKPDTERVLVLVDADDEDCRTLKKRLLKMWNDIDPRPEVLFRIAVRETETFFLGDYAALRSAFPKTKRSKLDGYVPDGEFATWEYLRDVIGEPPDSEDKRAWAESIGPKLSLDPEKNKSPSFRQLCTGFQRLCGEVIEPHRPRRIAKPKAAMQRRRSSP